MNPSILTDFKNATLTFLYIFQKAVIYKVLLRWCRNELASSANTLVLIAQQTQYESDSSMTNKVYDTNLLLLVFLDLKKEKIFH